MTKTLLMIVNPKAGKTKSSQPLFDVAAHFSESGYLVSIRCTQEPGHATFLAETEGGGFDVVVCCGGDGTLSETASGLMRLETPPPLGYIPCGSTNDFAASLGLSDDPLSVARAITASRGVKLDIGELNGRPFIYVASFGAFTRVSYAASQSVKNDLGHLAYFLEGVKDLSSLRPYHARVEAGEEVFEGDYLFGAVSNSTSIGGVMKLPAEKVTLDDGQFELMLVRVPTTMQELQDLIRGLLVQESRESIIFRHIRSATVRTAESYPWTLDGEFCEGKGLIEIRNLPQRLTFLI